MSNNKCSKDIIRAHSISKSKYLKTLTLDGHVFHFTPTSSGPDAIILDKISINKIKTFFGFCSYHGNKIFEPIDNNIVDVNNHNHLCLVMYRTLAEEICRVAHLVSFQKKIFSSLSGEKEDESYFINYSRKLMPTKQLQDLMLSHYKSQKMLKDLIWYKKSLERVLAKNNYNEIKHHVYIIQKKPKIAYSSIHYPKKDLYGNDVKKYKENSARNFPLFSISILPVLSEYVCILSCHTYDYNRLKPLLKSISINSENIQLVLSRIMIEKPDNIIFSNQLIDQDIELVKLLHFYVNNSKNYDTSQDYSNLYSNLNIL